MKWLQASKIKAFAIVYWIWLNLIEQVVTCMGCKGSSVRITPSRPKNSNENGQLSNHWPFLFLGCVKVPGGGQE